MKFIRLFLVLFTSLNLSLSNFGFSFSHAAAETSSSGSGSTSSTGSTSSSANKTGTSINPRSYEQYQQEQTQIKQAQEADKQQAAAKAAADKAKATAMNSQVSSMNNAAKKQKQQATMGTVIGLGVTAFCGYQSVTCYKSGGSDCWMWVAGTMAGLYATSQANKSGKQSLGTINDLSVADTGTNNNKTNPNGSGNGTGPGNNSNGDPIQAILGDPTQPNSVKKIASQVKSQLEDLSKNGVNIDLNKQTFTTPDGKTIPLSAYTGSGSGGQPANAKMAADFDKAMSQAKEAAAKTAAAVDVTEGWEGGAAGAGLNLNNGGANAAAGFGMPTFNPNSGLNSKSNFDRDPSSTGAASASYNGDAVLPAEANFWTQMNLRHEWLGQKGKVDPNLAAPTAPKW